ncbi:MAG: hypothetical protein AAF799_09610 [Myxococcota bacterium]
MQFADVLKTIFEKIAGFFDVFDLSFFVAGSIALAALTMEVHLLERADYAETKDKYEREQRLRLSAYHDAEGKKTALQNGIAALKVERAELQKSWETRADALVTAKEDDRARLERAVVLTRMDLERTRGRIRDHEERLIVATSLAARKKAISEIERETPVPIVERFVLDANLLLLVVGVYVAGLICFAVGRRIRAIPERFEKTWLLKRAYREPRAQRLENTLNTSIESHGLQDVSVLDPYLRESGDEDKNNEAGAPRKIGSPNHASALYGRLWVLLRESKSKESYALVRRYWVLAATYDGVATALLFWCAVLGLWILGVGTGRPPFGVILALAGVILVLFVVSILCYSEAQKFNDTQAYELMHTLAHVREPSTTPAPASPAGPAGATPSPPS